MCGPLEGLTGHFSGWGMCAHEEKDVAKQRYLLVVNPSKAHSDTI